jgi:hypothetical protein
VTQPGPLADSDFLAAVHDFEYTAFRLELQPAYAVPEEDELYAAWLRGEAGSALSVPELAEWYERVAGHVARGARVTRVRVQQDPPTDYQRFERWLDRWNIPAGERMRYMTESVAFTAGLLPDAGRLSDWWLLDSSRLVVLRFGDDGRRTGNEIITDPVVVLQACKWRDLAVHHSIRARSDVAA